MEQLPPGDRRASPPVDLNVINFQVGALQTSVDKGMYTLERTVERGFEGVDRRLGRIEDRQTQMERSQERSDARLEALEAFRREQETAEREAATVQRADLRLAMDGSDRAKINRQVAVLIVGALSALGTVTAILVAVGVFQ